MTAYKSILTLGFVLLALFSVRAQDGVVHAAPQASTLEDDWQQRPERIKADILNDIGTLDNKDRAKMYVVFGDVKWAIDKQESLRWIEKGVRLALDPQTDYDSSQSKIYALTKFVVDWSILERDPELGKILLNTIRELLFSEVKEHGPDGFGFAAAKLADYLVKTNPSLAYDFAEVAIKDRHNQFDRGTTNFLDDLRQKDRILSDKFFSEIVASATTADRPEEFIEEVINGGLNKHRWWEGFTVEQQRSLFEALATILKSKWQESVAADGDVCKSAETGTYLLSDFERILPERVELIQQLKQSCLQQDPAHFQPVKKYQTLADVTTAASGIRNLERRADFFWRAWAVTSAYKNFSLANEILDSCDGRVKSKLDGWEWARFTTGAREASERLDQSDFAGADEVIDRAPESLRPYLILNAVTEARSSAYHHPEETARLLERARIEFRKMKIPEPTPANMSRGLNPGRFLDLVIRYRELAEYASPALRRQYLDSALAIWDENADFLDQVCSQFPKDACEGETYFYFPYFEPWGAIYSSDFERLYGDISRIKNTITRLGFRIAFLRSAMR